MTRTLIEVRDLTKSYGKQLVFKDLNLAIQEHSLTTIYGPSGVGKTTLLKIMGGLATYQAGNVLFNGQVVPAKGARATRYRREHLAYVFQDYGLLEEQTIAANLKIALAYQKLTKKEKNLKMNEALKQVGLSYRLKTKVKLLSGGEKQRVALARALLAKGELVLADEPTGSLDLNLRNQVAELFIKLRSLGKTVVIVSHDPYFKEISDQVIELK